MAASAGFAELLREHLAPLGGLALRRMFGATGLSSHSVMFDLVKDDSLFLRVDDDNRPTHEGAGGVPVTYRRPGEVTAPACWTAPESLLDEPDGPLRWARVTLAAVHRVAVARTKRRGR